MQPNQPAPATQLSVPVGFSVLAVLAAAIAAPIAPIGRAVALLLAAAILIVWLACRLRERDRQLILLQAAGQDPVLWLDRAMRVRDASETGPGRGWIGQKLTALCHPDDAPQLAALLARRPPPPGPSAPIRLRAGSGGWKPTELMLARTEADGLLCRLRDVAAWREATEAAREHAGAYAAIAAQAGDMIVRVRADRTRAYVSPSAEGVLGYPAAALRDMDFTTITHPEDQDRVAAAFAALVAQGGQATCRFRMCHRVRGWIWVESRWTAEDAVTPDTAREVVAIVRDISARVAAEERTTFLARHDPLTGLANRTLFAERAEAALAQGGAAVLCLDLDLFKAVNDSLGHAAGDALLRQIAARLAGCARQSDTVARLGGDEFAILLPGAERAADAPGLAQRILAALAAPVMLGDHPAMISASLGVALAPAHGQDYDSLLRRADAALYRVKARGRGQWQVFEPAMERQRLARDRMTAALRAAVGRGDFVLHYLPSVRLADRAITGFEALLRWNHPERGLIRPGLFLPLAEAAGLMAPIADWVLRQAAADAASWPKPIGDPVGISVNLSASQLRARGLAWMVPQALAAAGLPPARLEIEISEPILAERDRDALATLHRLRAAGVRLALDDFGAGHGGMHYLRRFPVDRIKLDRSFTRELARSRATREIARSVASLARGLDVIGAAEGVETEAEAEALVAAGFTEAQGFLFARPMPADAVPGLLAAAPVQLAA